MQDGAHLCPAVGEQSRLWVMAMLSPNVNVGILSVSSVGRNLIPRAPVLCGGSGM